MSLGSRRTSKPTPVIPSHSERTIRVMSYNVNFGLMLDETPSTGAKTVLDAIKDSGVDICCMQETNQFYEQYFDEELNDLYPYQFFKHSENWYAGGVGVLSKYPINEVHWIPSKHGWFYGSIIEIDSPFGAIQMLNTHLRPSMDANSMIPTPMTFYRARNDRLDDIQEWHTHLDQTKPTIILGDFNESYNGMYYGHAVHWLHKQNYENSIKKHDPDTNTWVWPVSLGFTSITLTAKFDHIFYHQDFFTCSEGKVLIQGESDHRPCVATLHLK